MITVSPKHRIFLAVQPIDFRCGIDGIARICRSQYLQDPMTGHYFIFRNKRQTDLKLLYYDSQGFCLFQKRLSKGKFIAWPTPSIKMLTLTPSQLHVLIHNGDPTTVGPDKAWRSVIDETYQFAHEDVPSSSRSVS